MWNQIKISFLTLANKLNEDHFSVHLERTRRMSEPFGTRYLR